MLSRVSLSGLGTGKDMQQVERSRPVSLADLLLVIYLLEIFCILFDRGLSLPKGKHSKTLRLDRGVDCWLVEQLYPHSLINWQIFPLEILLGPMLLTSLSCLVFFFNDLFGTLKACSIVFGWLLVEVGWKNQESELSPLKSWNLIGKSVKFCI